MLLSLGDDVLRHVTSFLPICPLVRFSRSSKALRRLCLSPVSRWKTLTLAACDPTPVRFTAHFSWTEFPRGEGRVSSFRTKPASEGNQLSNLHYLAFSDIVVGKGVVLEEASKPPFFFLEGEALLCPSVRDVIHLCLPLQILSSFFVCPLFSDLSLVRATTHTNSSVSGEVIRVDGGNIWYKFNTNISVVLRSAISGMYVCICGKIFLPAQGEVLDSIRRFPKRGAEFGRVDTYVCWTEVRATDDEAEALPQLSGSLFVREVKG